MYFYYLIIMSFFFLINLMLILFLYLSKYTFNRLLKNLMFLTFFFILNIFFLVFMSLELFNFNISIMFSPILSGLKFYFLVDFYSLFFISVAMLVSNSIFLFAAAYFYSEVFDYTFISLLVLFLFFMFMLVFSGNFIFMFVGWEGVGIMSFVLISWWYSRSEASSGSLQAVVYNRFSDISMLLSIFILLMFVDSDLMLMIDSTLSFLFLFFFISVIAKSSQFLFHPWLPNAMESPTPVSSLLHSSTMVVASVFLMMRVAPLLEFMNLVFFFSAITSLFSGISAVMSYDFKKVVAFSTTSQLSFMLMALGLGLFKFCLLYILFHAFFKALIFMLSGLLIHGNNSSQDMRLMRPLFNSSTFSYMSLIFANFTMMGFPYLCSFWVKDLIIDNLFSGWFSSFFIVLSFFAVIFTASYSFRMITMISSISNKGVFSIMGMESFLSVSFKMILLVMSVIGSPLVLIFSPFDHLLLSFFQKITPLVLIFSSVVLSVLFSLWNMSFFSHYLFFWNPLVHKINFWSFLFYGKWLKFMDLIFLEISGPMGLGKYISALFLFTLAMGYFLTLLFQFF